MAVNPKKFQLMFPGIETNRRLRLNIEGKKVLATDSGQHLLLFGSWVQC